MNSLSVVFLRFLSLASLSLALSSTGCSSRNIYKDIHTSNGSTAQKEIIRRQWTYPIEPLSSTLVAGGIEFISPILDEQTLLFGSSRFGITALYPNLVRERWKTKNSNGIVSPIEVKDHVAYYTNGEGSLVAVSVENGKQLWSYALRNPVSSRPTVAGKDLYLTTSDDAVISVEAQTGKWQWHYRRRNATGPTVHGASAPLVIGDVVWAGFSDGALVALSRKEGKVLWEKILNNNKRFADLNADFTLSGDHVLVTAYDNALYSLNAKTGETLWGQENLGGSRGVSVENGIVYCGSSLGYAYAIDEKTGKIIWKFELDIPVASSVTVLEKHVVVASSAQFFYVLEKLTGKIIERIDIGYGSGFGGPFVYDAPHKLLYGVSRGGNLLALSYHP